ncbi:MAG: MoxR family ATPase [Pirellulales bacterium]|nr:MoxR family ATPase [Pirellulales bacterium]
MREVVEALERNVNQVVLGKPDVVRLCVVALLAGEHVLLEDVPGVGKTLLGKALARSVDGVFCRIQFTPDLLPSDIVGSNLYQAKTGEFVFRPGPIFANVVLADEINRTPPRTQSALLEAMSDRQVSVDGQTYSLPRPFLVIATQNPYEYEGTYALPESQMDRFLLRTRIGYPGRDDERRVLDSHRQGEPVDQLAPVLGSDQVQAVAAAVRQVAVDRAIDDYILDIVAATRDSADIQVGASTRAALGLYRASQALALVEGREYVVPDDVKRLTVPVLAHRVIAKGGLYGTQRDVVEAIIERLIAIVPAPS